MKLNHTASVYGSNPALFFFFILMSIIYIQDFCIQKNKTNKVIFENVNIYAGKEKRQDCTFQNHCGLCRTVYVAEVDLH